MQAGDLRYYHLYGLLVESDVPLTARQVSPSALPDVLPNVVLTRTENQIVPSSAPEGEVLSELMLNESVGYIFVQRPGGEYVIRFYNACEFTLDPDLKHVRVFQDPKATEGIISLLFSGNVITLLLSLRGEFVLHASAVEVQGRVLAFVGASGMGKSTLAGLCCASGARLVVDDVLRMKKCDDALLCYPGTHEIRLRPGAATVAELFASQTQNKTVDQRLGVLLEGSEDLYPLKAIVFPRPDRGVPSLQVTLLDKARALYFLSSYPRILGWKKQEKIKQQFESFAEVARMVPLYEATIPWGPPFSPGLAGDIFRNVGLL